jgi:hypothetical protein
VEWPITPCRARGRNIPQAVWGCSQHAAAAEASAAQGPLRLWLGRQRVRAPHALPPLGSHDRSATIMIAAMLTLMVAALLMVAPMFAAEIGWLMVDPTRRGK